MLAKTTDGSTYIYIKDLSLVDEVRAIVQQVPGIEMIYTSADIIKWHIDPEATLLLKRKTVFSLQMKLVVVEPTDEKELGQSDRYKAVHDSDRIK
ncbi:hypothetical protein [Leuconostoc mesenteroides]|uniref:hypothetical protein n=1 Tax=Leuconostoc mesenteroides TaxID=1245 RepID=UPI001FA8B443|nr:hypothetical protein [Leuconostoc mesenteroides]